MLNLHKQSIKSLSEKSTDLKYHIRTIVYSVDDGYVDATDIYGCDGDSVKTYSYQDALNILDYDCGHVFYDECENEQDMAEHKKLVQDELQSLGLSHTFQPYLNEGLVGMYPFFGHEGLMFIQVTTAE
jgi:hypothetical protein